MIDIQQLTSLISAFRVETEKESISPETVGSILQAIADLLATATSETEYNIIRFWKETKGSCYLFYLAITGKESLKLFILLLIREKIVSHSRPMT